MDIRKMRKSLDITLQEAADLVGCTREAVRLAEAGKAPKAAAQLAKVYKSKLSKKVHKTVKHNIEITFRFVRRGEQTVLQSESSLPFEITDGLIDAIIDGLTQGKAVASTVEI